jgi:hypothetical protein
MMRKIVFIGLLLLMIVVQGQAVDGDYRLRVPSATEHIERITRIAQQQDPQSEWQTRNLYSVLTDLVFRRFPDLDLVDYQQILAAYDAMGIGHDGYFWRRGPWVEAILTAWLRQTQPDLSRHKELTFGDFRIGILPYDFDMDGQDEYVLDVIKGEPTDRYACRYQAEYVNYLVVRSTNSGYQLIKTPLYWEVMALMPLQTLVKAVRSNSNLKISTRMVYQSGWCLSVVKPLVAPVWGMRIRDSSLF